MNKKKTYAIPVRVYDNDKCFVRFLTKEANEELCKSLADLLADGKEYICSMPPAKITIDTMATPQKYAKIDQRLTVMELIRCGACVHHYTADCPLHFEYDPLDDFYCGSGERIEE